MKKATLLLIIIGLAIVLFAGWWYEHGLFMVVPDQAVPNSSPSTISGKAVRDAADAADKYRSDLKTYGKVPLNASGLPRNPSPLFGASGQ